MKNMTLKTLSWLFLLIVSAAFTLAATDLSLEPQSLTIDNNETFNIIATIDTNESIVGAQFVINFNNSLMEVNTYSVGDFLKQDGSSVFDLSEVNNTAGYIDVVMLQDPLNGATGQGNIINITFKSKAQGTSDVTITGTEFGDSDANPIAVDSIENSVVNITNETIETVPDFSLSYNAPSSIRPGKNGSGMLTIENTGEENLTCNISTNDFVFNTSTVGTQLQANQIDVDMNEQENISILFNASEDQETGTYLGTVSVSCNDLVKELEANVTVSKLPIIGFMISADPITLQQGENGNITLIIYSALDTNVSLTDANLSNNGNIIEAIPETYSVEITDNVANVTYTVNTLPTDSVGLYLGDTVIDSDKFPPIAYQLEVNVTEIPSNISTTISSSSALQGEDVSVNITVRNDADIATEVNVSLDQLSNANSVLNFSINENAIIAAGDNLNIFRSIQTSQDAAPGTYSGQATISYNDKTENYPVSLTVLEIEENITVTPSINLEWVNELADQDSAILTVQNNGNVAQDITMSISDLVGPEVISANQVQISLATFTLGAGDSQNITISIDNLGDRLTGSYQADITTSYDGQSANTILNLDVRDAQYSVSSLNRIRMSGALRDKTVSTLITIINDGDFDLTNINVSNNLPQRYNANISPTTITRLNKGDSIIMNLSLFVPQDESPGESSVGNVFLDSSNFQKSIPVILDVESALQINELNIKIGGNRKEELEDGDKARDEAKPGDRIVFELEIANLLEDLEMEDVEVQIDIENIDEGDDIDLESDEFDIDEDDEEDVELEFTVPYLVEAKDYNAVITVSGEDEDGNDHETTWTISFEVEKERHEIIIQRASISPSRLSCSRLTTLETKIINIGERDEDDVRVEITNSDLGVSQARTFDLESGDDDDAERLLSFSVNIPEDVDADSYPINIRVERDGIFETSQTVNIDVEECDIIDDIDGDDGDNNGGIIVRNDTVILPQRPTSQSKSTLEEIRESDLYLPALGVIVVGLGVAVLAMIPK